jgi:proteasome accessory factor C
MAKPKPAPIIHTERLLALVPFITAHQGILLKDLAAAFDVTTKTMNDDLTTLWMCGLPGYTALELMDLSFDSGYVTIRNAPTLKAPRKLGMEEIVALLLGLSLLKESVGENVALVDRINTLAERLGEKVGTPTKFDVINPVSSAVRAQIITAITKQQTLSIAYHSLYNDEFSNREVKPLEMRIDGGVEYLFAYCYKASAFRIFRIDRIESLNINEKTTHQSFDAQSVAPDGFDSLITFYSRLRLMKERFDLQDAKVNQKTTIHSFSKQWIIRSVFASSGSATLGAPSEIRAEIAQKAQSLLKRYIALQTS